MATLIRQLNEVKAIETRANMYQTWGDSTRQRQDNARESTGSERVRQGDFGVTRYTWMARLAAML
ncbi:hypothetical protein KIN20_030616 [Parelaphostrongylus tenuis]|uniref:Uncharacterized protein n=1 Tax=Parelaphostrongylus tenuis TaxID=148309 RepID=A0AAD5R401_PARTN|nr:hypothetical protein KIN20_030616 [Parelaphostrongylus tenuis]